MLGLGVEKKRYIVQCYMTSPRSSFAKEDGAEKTEAGAEDSADEEAREKGLRFAFEGASGEAVVSSSGASIGVKLGLSFFRVRLALLRGGLRGFSGR